jgi:hypothetical protein
MKSALDARADRLNPRVVEEIKSWSNHPELSKILRNLQAAQGQHFFDFYAEAVVARHLLQKGCELAVELPTPSGRTADLQVSMGGSRFYAHIKRLNADKESHKDIILLNRLQPLRSIRRPIILSGLFWRIPTDAEMREVYRQLKPFAERAEVGESIALNDGSGNDIAEFHIGGANGGTTLQFVINFGVTVLDENKRLYKKLSEAYKQFMPGALNVILVTSSFADDIKDFESALLGDTYEDYTVTPYKKARTNNGFWSADKHPESNIAGWFNFDCRNDYINFRMCYRGNCQVPGVVKELFETTP